MFAQIIFLATGCKFDGATETQGYTDRQMPLPSAILISFEGEIFDWVELVQYTIQIRVRPYWQLDASRVNLKKMSECDADIEK
jgi:hypothetical protein